MVLTAYFVLSPVTGLFCHRHQRNCFHRLDTSVGGVRTTRLRRPPSCRSSKALSASTASHPAFVTTAKRPSVERDGVSFKSDLGQTGNGIFFQKGLDGPNHFDPVQQNSVLARAP